MSTTFPVFPYLLLLLLRLILTLLPLGYIHPDEYFQSIEIRAQDMLHIHAYRAWEYTSQHPIRNVVMPIIITLPLTWMDATTHPYIVFVMPRLMMFVGTLIVGELIDACM